MKMTPLRAASFDLVGVVDWSQGSHLAEALARRADPRGPSVLLAHQPSQAPSGRRAAWPFCTAIRRSCSRDSP